MCLSILNDWNVNRYLVKGVISKADRQFSHVHSEEKN
jgi:hypothetical protein